jgi:hypothetical protein
MVAVTSLGTVLAGIGLVVYGWPVFWAGVGVTFAGILYGRLIRIMEYTEEYVPTEDPRVIEPATQRGHG